MTIEVETRGPLSKGKFYGLKKFFDENSRFVMKKERLSLIYFGKFIPKDVEEIKDEKIDLRLRVTNKKSEIILKSGDWSGSDARREISIPIETSKFDEAIEFLRYLGWHICVAYATETFVYQYKGIEFSLVDIKDFGYTFEAEILVDNDKGSVKAKQKILNVCKELGLKEYQEGEFEKQCNEINNTGGLQFNFNKAPILEFLNRFKEFF